MFLNFRWTLSCRREKIFLHDFRQRFVFYFNPKLFFFYKKVEEILVKNAYRKIATEYSYWAKRRLCKLLRLLYKRCSVNALYVVKEDFQNVLDKTQVSNNYVTRSSHTYVCIFYSFMNYHVWKGSIHSDGFE